MLVSHSRRNYFRLLLALAVLGLLYPLLELRGTSWRRLGLVAWTLSFWAVLFVSLQAILASRRALRLARILLGTALGLGGLGLFLEFGAAESQLFPLVQAGAWLLSLLFLAQTTWAVLVDVAAPGKVDVNRIWGAVCVYILMALCWAHAHALLEFFSPGSLRVEGVAPSAGMSVMLYYSFVTITTLGFGDVVPVHPAARLFAGAEALMGQLYLTVVVARLVGLHISHARSPAAEPEDPAGPRS